VAPEVGRRPEAGRFVQASPWLAAAVPLAALAALAWVTLAGLDESLFFLFNGLSRVTGTALWAHITILGDGLVCAVLVLLWVRRHPERIWGGLLGAVIMVAVLHGTKALLSVPRPLGVLPAEMVEVIGPGHRRGAFPSGHTATAFLYAGVWALSLRRPHPPLVPVPGRCRGNLPHGGGSPLAFGRPGRSGVGLGLRVAGAPLGQPDPLGRGPPGPPRPGRDPPGLRPRAPHHRPHGLSREPFSSNAFWP
jgi:hypothetical protein